MVGVQPPGVTMVLMFLLRKCSLTDFDVWALQLSHTMHFPTLKSTTGNIESIHFINNSEFTHDFAWVVVNNGPIFLVNDTTILTFMDNKRCAFAAILPSTHTCSNMHLRKSGGFHDKMFLVFKINCVISKIFKNTAILSIKFFFKCNFRESISLKRHTAHRSLNQNGISKLR